MRRKDKYWILFELWECPVCGRGKEYRIRQYSKKPKDVSKRYTFVTYYDWCDVL